MIVFILFVVFLVSVGYSVSQIGVSTPSGGGGSSQVVSFGNDVITISSHVSISNGGLYPISNLKVDTVASLAGGARIGGGPGETQTVGRGQNLSIPVRVAVDVATGDAGQRLLTQSAELDIDGWLNATFGYVIEVGVGFHQNDSWGAPFQDYRVNATIAPGSAALTISFQNRASLTIVGSLQITLEDSISGRACGSATLSIVADPGAPYTNVAEAPLAAGCTPDTAVSVISGAGYSLTIPPESIS